MRTGYFTTQCTCTAAAAAAPYLPVIRREVRKEAGQPLLAGSANRAQQTQLARGFPRVGASRLALLRWPLQRHRQLLPQQLQNVLGVVQDLGLCQLDALVDERAAFAACREGAASACVKRVALPCSQDNEDDSNSH